MVAVKAAPGPCTKRKGDTEQADNEACSLAGEHSRRMLGSMRGQKRTADKAGGWPQEGYALQKAQA